MNFGWDMMKNNCAVGEVIWAIAQYESYSLFYFLLIRDTLQAIIALVVLYHHRPILKFTPGWIKFSKNNRIRIKIDEFPWSKL